MALWENLAAALASAVREEDVLAAVADVAGPALGAELVTISLLQGDRRASRR